MVKSRSFLLSFPLMALLLAAAVVPFAFGMVPTVRFTSERIDVHVYPGEIVVEGVYFYKNPFPLPVMQGFTIPFPVDKDHPEPLEVKVERLAEGRGALLTRRALGRTGFEAAFGAYEEAGIRVSYRQKARGQNGTYILTTTRHWGRPLERGVYFLHPHGTVIVSSNYQLDLPGTQSGFQRTGFMPDRDWQFTWRREHEKN